MGITIQHAKRPAGLETYMNLDLGATGVLIIGTTAAIYDYYIRNNATAVRYIKFYDKGTAPTVGTDTPLRVIGIPATGAANLFIAEGIKFSSGIGIGAVTTVANNSTTAPSTNDVVVNIGYR